VRTLWIVVCAPFALLAVALLLAVTGLFGKLPSFEELENPSSNISTEIYSEDGQLLGSFYIQNRSFVDYRQIAPGVVAALISTEDARFYSHSGIDFVALARVAARTVAMGDRGQGGGSTITQQLAKNLFPRDTTIYTNKFSRNSVVAMAKLKEWITAVKLEYNYTKEEILAMYLNTVEYGSNAFGIKSAAHTFFGKEPSELNLQEGALLVGVVNAPTKYSPVRNRQNALARRNLVLSRMEKAGFISRNQLDSLTLLPIELKYTPISHNDGTATYFREMLRLTMTARRPLRSQFLNDWDYEQEVERWERNPLYGWCEKNRRSDGSQYNIYRDGLKIYTTINSAMQTFGEQALENQLKKVIQPAMESQYKRTKTLFWNTTREMQEQIVHNAMRHTDRYRNLKNGGASEAEIEKSFNTPVEMSLFSYKGDVDTVMTPRDSILYYKRMMRASFVAIDPATGHVKAYVGGQDFRRFKYDMVKQGKRQVGSTIKPFIYTFAINHLGFSPCTMVPNLPTTIETETGDAWQPKEAGKVVYDGELKPLSWGLANSRNNYSAWIMKQAKQPAAVADFIHRMGISSYLDPVYSLCLGSSDVSLFEMAGAYATFANGGVHNEPIFVTRIEDKHGNLLATFTTPAHDAIDEQTAYTMVGMLKNVINAGTAGRLRYQYKFTAEMGGKTGTSQNASDAWFLGITPRLVAGAWVGGEDRSVHLLAGGEGAVMALPIYADFMQKVYADPKLGVRQTDTFRTPANGLAHYDCQTMGVAMKADSVATDEFFDR
jgi:penicillin-binding protein 1A